MNVNPDGSNINPLLGSSSAGRPRERGSVIEETALPSDEVILATDSLPGLITVGGNESKRAQQQAAGRSTRSGEPGEARFYGSKEREPGSAPVFLSLEDHATSQPDVHPFNYWQALMQ